MIALPPGARVWLACGATDMRRGMPGLALMVQEALGRDPHAGDLFVFRGKQGSLLKILWHDGVGMSRLSQAAGEGALHLADAQGRFEAGLARRDAWPRGGHARRRRPGGRSVAISAAQLAYMLDGIVERDFLVTH